MARASSGMFVRARRLGHKSRGLGRSGNRNLIESFVS